MLLVVIDYHVRANAYTRWKGITLAATSTKVFELLENWDVPKSFGFLSFVFAMSRTRPEAWFD